MRRGRRGPGREAGFTYLGLLFLIVLITLMLAKAGEVARTTAQREREKDLLFVGHAYRTAIGRYIARNGRYPRSLDELLGSVGDDKLPVHYLRRLYRDPMTRGADWVLVPAIDGGVMGVASASTDVPLKRAGFDSYDVAFGTAETYRDWEFRFEIRNRFFPGIAGGAPAAPSSH